MRLIRSISTSRIHQLIGEQTAWVWHVQIKYEVERREAVKIAALLAKIRYLSSGIDIRFRCVIEHLRSYVVVIKIMAARSSRLLFARHRLIYFTLAAIFVFACTAVYNCVAFASGKIAETRIHEVFSSLVANLNVYNEACGRFPESMYQLFGGDPDGERRLRTATSQRSAVYATYIDDTGYSQFVLMYAIDNQQSSVYPGYIYRSDTRQWSVDN